MSTVVLDTCIVNYLLKPKTSSAMYNVLQSFLKNNEISELDDPVISDFTKFECLRGAINIKRVNDHLEKYKTIKVTNEVLITAAFLYSVSKNPNDGHVQSDGDCIIGATAFLLMQSKNAFVLTGDGNDFPRPFFTEVAVHELIYGNGNKQKSQHIFLLKPNWKALSEKLKVYRKN